MRRLLLAFVMLLTAQAANATNLIEFDFQGNGGFGLLPGNEVGANTSLGSNSLATGGESGGGIVFDSLTNELSIEFSFEGLNGGLLFAAGTGIHLHRGVDPANAEPFDQTGAIVYNLNNFDANDSVENLNTQIPDGTTSGTVSATIDIDPADVAPLLAGEFYLNIHSADFSGGELRGNLVAVPEPTTFGLAGLGAVAAAAAARRRR